MARVKRGVTIAIEAAIAHDTGCGGTAQVLWLRP